MINEVFDLFDQLGATDEQLDFPIVYTSAIAGTSGLEPDQLEDNMNPLFESIIKHTPKPDVEQDGPFQLQVCALDYSNFQGAIAIGKINRGSVKKNTPITIVKPDDKTDSGRLLQIYTYHGLDKVEQEEAHAGEIVCLTRC